MAAGEVEVPEKVMAELPAETRTAALAAATAKAASGGGTVTVEKPTAEAEAEATADAEPTAEAETEPAAEATAEAETEPAAEAEPTAEAEASEPEPAGALAATGAMAFLSGDQTADLRERMTAAQNLYQTAPAEAIAQAEMVLTYAVATVNRALLNDIMSIGGSGPADQSEPSDGSDTLGRYRERLERILAL
ncbi:MAG TPA: hypothetical protein VF163_15565 [Micromonosporaceae bacterium]